MLPAALGISGLEDGFSSLCSHHPAGHLRLDPWYQAVATPSAFLCPRGSAGPHPWPTDRGGRSSGLQAAGQVFGVRAMTGLGSPFMNSRRRAPAWLPDEASGRPDRPFRVGPDGHSAPMPASVGLRPVLIAGAVAASLLGSSL